ncbi:hypothetical protein BB407_00465 [Helicobacter pylori]|nr:hypothetical protein BB407_00465 [Helicobacter pylori]
MIAKPFYLLKKIIFTTKFTNKSKEKILFTINLKQPNQKQSKLKPLFYSYPHSNNLISFKTALLQTNLKQPNQTTKVKNPFFITTPIQTISFF